jgi:hypothetical protein
VELELHSFVTSALGGGKWSSFPAFFTAGESARKMDETESLSGDFGEEKNLSSLPGIKSRFIGLPALA